MINGAGRRRRFRSLSLRRGTCGAPPPLCTSGASASVGMEVRISTPPSGGTLGASVRHRVRVRTEARGFDSCGARRSAGGIPRNAVPPALARPSASRPPFNATARPGPTTRSSFPVVGSLPGWRSHIQVPRLSAWDSRRVAGARPCPSIRPRTYSGCTGVAVSMPRNAAFRAHASRLAFSSSQGPTRASGSYFPRMFHGRARLLDVAVGPGSVLFKEARMLVKQRQAARKRRKEARKARSAARSVCETIDAARKPIEIRVQEDPLPARRGFLRGLRLSRSKSSSRPRARR